MSKRKYDTSLSTDFYVQVVFDRGHWVLERTDNTNWSLTGFEGGPKFNGSGAASGPSELVSKEQAETYVRHLAYLWNADVDRRRAEASNG